MLKVSEILKVKGDILYTVTPDTPVQQAFQTMSELDVGSLVVMEHGELVGMLTFREVIQHISKACEITPSSVRTIMDDAPVSVTPNTSAAEVQRLMLDKHARYIPVMDGPVLQGVISFYDMAKALVHAQQFENRMLKAYIRDWPEDHSALS